MMYLNFSFLVINCIGQRMDTISAMKLIMKLKKQLCPTVPIIKEIDSLFFVIEISIDNIYMLPVTCYLQFITKTLTFTFTLTICLTSSIPCCDSFTEIVEELKH